MAEDKREPTRALDKASRVMDALAAENGLSPADIADACDIPRSFRIPCAGWTGRCGVGRNGYGWQLLIITGLAAIG